MKGKKYWAWRLVTKEGSVQGNVWAVDPRDAASRALCSEAPSGNLVGQECAIPVHCLHSFPANDESVFELCEDDFTLRVEAV